MGNKSNVVYSLNIEDIQTVAIREIDRELAEDEVEKVKNLIGEYVNWYDAILNSIIEIISLSDSKLS